MNQEKSQIIKEYFPQARFEEPLSKHCTFCIGGPAEAFIEIDNLSEQTQENLVNLTKYLQKSKIPYIIIGGGSNILFHDKGFKGVVMKITAKTLKFTKTNLEADAGSILQNILKEASKRGFYNLQPFTGIPGTLGGAIYGNAGANGLEIKDILKEAIIFNPRLSMIYKATPETLKFKYRYSNLKETKEIVLKATLNLSKAAKHKALAKKLNAKRTQTQPYGLSAGSFFKNPDPRRSSAQQLKAGYLIDQCGLKGRQIGQAKISEKHANFIQNAGTLKHPATQKDILRLANLAKKEVRRRFKIDLKEEVQIIPYKPKKSI